MPAVNRDVAGLIARIALGVVLIAHGYQKFFTWTMSGTADSFDMMGVPAPVASAWIAAIIELIGGILLVLGLFQSVVGLLVFLDMLGALFIVHISNGIFVGDGGYELVLIIGALALMVAAFGSGRFALDNVVFKKNKAVTA